MDCPGGGDAKRKGRQPEWEQEGLRGWHVAVISLIWSRYPFCCCLERVSEAVVVGQKCQAEQVGLRVAEFCSKAVLGLFQVGQVNFFLSISLSLRQDCDKKSPNTHTSWRRLELYVKGLSN